MKPTKCDRCRADGCTESWVREDDVFHFCSVDCLYRAVVDSGLSEKGKTNEAQLKKVFQFIVERKLEDAWSAWLEGDYMDWLEKHGKNESEE